MIGFPKSEDLRVSREMAKRIAAAAGGSVERIVLYGSRVRGEAREDSDFDLLVVLNRALSGEEERRLQIAAEAGREGIPEVHTVSAEQFDKTRDIVGYLSYFAMYDGVTVYERARATGTSSRGPVAG